MIWKYGFTANEAIAFMRIVRPGSVVGPQQQYMYLKQLEWAKWAAVDEFRKAQATCGVPSAAPIAPVTPPAETDEEPDTIQTTPTNSLTTLPPVTPGRHIATAAAKAKAIAPPGQPRKTPAKRVAQDSDEEDSEDILPDLNFIPTTQKVKAAGPRGVTSSEQRPARVTRSTAGAANIRKTGMAPPPSSPAKSSRQGPNKIPRLATTRTTSAAKAVAAAASHQTQLRTTRAPPSPTPPSRLPTLIPSKKPHHVSSLSEVANITGFKRSGTLTSDAWVANNTAAVVVPASKSTRPGLRSVRRRRSSFSSADVVA
jgi:cell division cycle 14